MSEAKVYGFFNLMAKIGIGGVLFFIPISHALVSLFTGVALLGFIGKKLIKPDFQWLETRQNIYLAAFFFFMALSLVNSGQYIEKSLVALFLKWGKYIVLSLIIQDSIKKRKDAVIFISIFLFSAALAAISGITQLFWGVEFLRGREISIIKGGKAITSSFNHSNGLGAYLIIPFSLCLAFLKAPQKFKLRAQYLILFLGVILVFCIFHTYSRGTWIGVIVAMVTMLFISRKPAIIFSTAVIIGVLLSVPEFRQFLFAILQTGGDSDRFKYWQAASTMFKENPFLGKGLGTFMAHFSEYLPKTGVISYAHNCFLQILAESGIFSLIAFLGFIYSVIYAGIKKFIPTRDPILLGGICGIAGFLAHSFFEVNLYSLALAVLFWLWIGIVVRLSSLEE